MNLLPEFQKVVDDVSIQLAASSRMWDTTVVQIVTRCQELALRVPEMSVNEISDAFYNKGCESFLGRAQQLLAAYESRRFQPVKRVIKHRNWISESGDIYCATEQLTDLSWTTPFGSCGTKWLGDIFEREV